MYKETAGARELIGLPRQHPQGQLFVANLGVGEIQLGLERIHIISEIGGSPGTLRLQRLQALFLEFVLLNINASPDVEVTSHKVSFPTMSRPVARCGSTRDRMSVPTQAHT
jgi:hypothetical protein